ncbi:hypothetical protein [Actinoplanes sp. GCM10030250]|uniref:hypothetical protein n=1 Tax=Actinoplanes sp. GCM10030250 TaxID=3273376 RepID=UPI0036237316
MTDEWITALARYAGRFHTTAGTGHHVASPLGAWLLLALTASADDASRGASSDASRRASSDASRRASRDASEELAEVLGVAPAEAAKVAAALLENPHPLVAAATAVWHSDRVDPQQLTGWRATLPAVTEFGPLPDGAGLDQWARDNTFGLIDRFPITRSPQIVLLLASALATKLSWDNPFDVVPAEELGGAWAGRVRQVLRTPRGGHTAFVTTSRIAGDVIVHAAPATDDESGAKMWVVSVAAAPDVAPEQVLAAAYEIAGDLASDPKGKREGKQETREGEHVVERISLFDLPLGEAPLWTIREEQRSAWDREHVSAVLPAWSATSDHDLSVRGLGFDAATRVLEPVLGLSDLGFEARQAATARFSRYGFEAAAVTGFATLTSLPPEQSVRFAELRFAHPYAVVAATAQPGPWQGVPVFSAWIETPEDVTE